MRLLLRAAGRAAARRAAPAIVTAAAHHGRPAAGVVVGDVGAAVAFARAASAARSPSRACSSDGSSRTDRLYAAAASAYRPWIIRTRPFAHQSRALSGSSASPCSYSSRARSYLAWSS